jgi:hypothetical protein
MLDVNERRNNKNEDDECAFPQRVIGYRMIINVIKVVKNN